MPKQATQIHLKPSPSHKSVPTTKKSANSETKKTETAEIKSQQTSPTLIEFQNRNADLPEWRLQLKNAVQKRLNETSESSANISPISLTKSYPTSGGNALKAEIFDDIQPDKIENEQLAKALRRIEHSRRKYYIVEEEKPVEVFKAEEEKPAKEYPFKIASRNDNPVSKNDAELKSSVNFPNKPKLVPKPKNNAYKSLYDTSELDPNFIPAKVASSFEKRPVEDKPVKSRHEKAFTKAEFEKAEIVSQNENPQLSEADDLAPFSLRFNAGLFDLISNRTRVLPFTMIRIGKSNIYRVS